MQSTQHAFRQHVVPHSPGAIGSIAGEETGANLRAQFLIAPAALAARPCQPGIEPTPRDTERPAQPFRRPDPPVLRYEPELHVDSFAKWAAAFLRNGNLGRYRVWLQAEAERLGAAVKIADDTLSVACLVIGCARVDVIHPMSKR